MCSCWRCLSLRKQSAEFLPPTHICGFISHKQMKNKRAAGILGSHGRPRRNQPGRKRVGAWRLCRWAARMSQKVRSEIHRSGALCFFVTGVFSLNIGEDISEVFRYVTNARNSQLIKIAVNPLSNKWFLRSQTLSARIYMVSLPRVPYLRFKGKKTFHKYS